jgi:hypothetical protein
MNAKVDSEFNERMTQAMLRGVRFADTPLPTYKRDSGLPHGYFKQSLLERIFGWRRQ